MPPAEEPYGKLNVYTRTQVSSNISIANALLISEVQDYQMIYLLQHPEHHHDAWCKMASHAPDFAYG